MDNDAEELDLRDYLDTIEDFCADIESRTVPNSEISGSKGIGTYFEEELRGWFEEKHDFISEGSVGIHVDLPVFNVDVRATSNSQPQSSSKAVDPGERLVGVNYNILLFVYDREKVNEQSRFEIVSCVYIPKEYAADHRITEDVRKLVGEYENDELSEDDLREQLEGMTGTSFGEISQEMFERIKKNPPEKGVITISPAIQWRFRYSKMNKPEVPDEVDRIYGSIGSQSTLSDIGE